MARNLPPPCPLRHPQPRPRSALPDIHILYFGETHTFSLPPSNAWALIALTVPASLLVAALIGLLFALVRISVATDSRYSSS